MLLFLCTLLHFTVDGVCAAVLAGYAVNEPDYSMIVYYFGLYNLIAFGGQCLAGLILDRWKSLILPSLAAVPVLLAGGFLQTAGIFWQSVLVALGNCMFHVSAGILILERYGNFREPGIFVSSGAVGLGLGLYQIVGATFFEAVCILGTAITLFLLLKSPATPEHEPDATPEVHGVDLLPLMAGTVMLLVCVVLRGFGGSSHIPGYVMLMPCVFMLGKSSGGILCDVLGFRRTILAIFLLSFAAIQMPGVVCAITLAFAFNMTMPLTLRLLHWYFPEYPGLTFGLAAGCLLPGAFFGGYLNITPHVMAVLQFLGLFAAGLIFLRYGRGRKSLPQF